MLDTWTVTLINHVYIPRFYGKEVLFRAGQANACSKSMNEYHLLLR